MPEFGYLKNQDTVLQKKVTIIFSIRKICMHLIAKLIHIIHISIEEMSESEVYKPLAAILNFGSILKKSLAHPMLLGM